MPKPANKMKKVLPSKSGRSKAGADSKKQEVKHYPRSYRLDPALIDILKDTQDKVNQISPKKISEGRLIKALIWLSKDIDAKQILHALKEVL